MITVTESKFVSVGSAYDLTAGDSLFMYRGVAVSTTAFNATIHGAGGNSVTLNGTVGGGYFAVGLEGSNNKLFVGETGLISGGAYGVFTGKGDTVINHGTIFGNAEGIDVSGDGLVLKNDGSILSGPNGSFAIYNQFSGLVIIANSGLIQAVNAGKYSYYSVGQATEAFTNAGTMIGNVMLGSSNDSFNSTKGRVVGTIDGGAGSDKITGGAHTDRMTGGTENDTFYFRIKADNHAIDHITDFARSEGDKIGLSKSFFKLDPSQSVASAFQDITSGGFGKEGVHKHILYNHDTGFLYYDKDGKGGATPIHFATLDTDPSIGSSDILMV